MNGIEKITQRIEDEARQEAESILKEARADAQAISEKYRVQAEKERESVLEKGRRAADERVERLASAARLEARNLSLSTHQALIDSAFDKALEQLCSLPEEEYVELLAGLAAKASVSGREKVILSPADHAKVGPAVVKRANAILAEKVSPKLPQELTETKPGAILDKVLSGASAILAGTGMLSLAEETAPIRGGLILSDGDVDVNCTFETLVRLGREEMGGEVSQLLFAQ